MITIINKERMKEVTPKRNTVQKSTVENIVLTACNHPTAEYIFEEARKQIPTIGLGTVYRILKDLVADGKVRLISIPDAPDRFDKTTCTHAHFFCEKCGIVEDVNYDCSVPALDNGAVVNKTEILFEGVCKDCLNAK